MIQYAPIMLIAKAAPNQRAPAGPALISGTPAKGEYEPLDFSKPRPTFRNASLSYLGYRMRTGTEARQFFRIGRVSFNIKIDIVRRLQLKCK